MPLVVLLDVGPENVHPRGPPRHAPPPAAHDRRGGAAARLASLQVARATVELGLLVLAALAANAVKGATKGATTPAPAEARP